MDNDAPAPSIAKHLASCSTRTRTQALTNLTTFLLSHPSISDSDMLKIWKGLFYSIWHADKPPVQLRLIQRISSLLVSLHPCPLSLQYLRSFISTIRREWSGIDSLRLDKFYLLIRRFIYHLFLLLKSTAWDLKLTNQLMDLLLEMTLLPSDNYPANGVNYHISEVFLEELKELLPLAVDVIDALLRPFFIVLEKSKDKVLLNKIKKSVFNLLIENGRRKISDLGKEGNCTVSDDKEVENFGILALKLGFSAKFFRSASEPNAVQANRKLLFGLHEEFLKLEKDFEKLGVEISLPEVNVGHSEFVFAGAAEALLEKVESNPGGRRVSKKSKKSGKKSCADKESKSKKKKKKDGSSDSGMMEVVSVGENADIGISLDQSVISNLQKQFEKVAAEAGMDMDGASSCAMPTAAPNGTASKKRKRAKSVDGKVSLSESGMGGSAIGKSGEKSAKKVRFSMKNNLVWKPHSPLPPQSLRLPPSATPRGSALKKGVPPGPIMEAALVKKVKHRGSVGKKGGKITKTISPAVKRLRKLQSLSA